MSDKFNNKYSEAKAGKTRISTSANEWVANAIKSLGYSSMDILNDVLPSTIDAVKSVGELSQEVVDSVKDLKGQSSRLKSALDQNAYFEIGRNFKNYTLEDLKSGKFYNNDRGSDDDFDFDFDSDFDIGDSSDYDATISAESNDGSSRVDIKSSSKDSSEIIQVQTNINSNNPMVDAVREQSRVAMSGANLISETTKQSQLLSMNHAAKLGAQTGAQLAVISDNISLIAEIMGDTLSKHATLSAQYYNDSMGALNNIVSELKIVGQQTKLTTANSTDMSSYKDYKNVVDTVFTAGGFVDIKEYLNLVRTQFDNAVDSNLFLSSAKGMLSQTDVFLDMAKNPLRFIPDMIVKKFIPSIVQEAARQFDETFRETAVAGLYQIRNLANSSNLLYEFLGKTFGISNDMKTEVDKSNYIKDAVSFDGITHRTINDVIPFYLRRIDAALRGTQEIAFDYNKGVFDSVSKITEDLNAERSRRLLGGLSSVKGDFREYLSNFQFVDNEQFNQTLDNMQKLLEGMVKRDGGINFRRIQNKDGSYRDDIADILGITNADDPTLNLIRGFFKGSDNAYNLRVFGREVLEARAGYDKFMREVEANPILYNNNLMNNGVAFDSHIGDAKDRAKANGPSKLSGLLGVDKFGKDIFYYLRETMSMIAKGVGVYILGGNLDSGGGRFRKTKDTNVVTNPHDKIIKKLKDEKSKVDDKLKKQKPSTAISEDKLAKVAEKGTKIIVDTRGTNEDRNPSVEQGITLRRNQVEQERAEANPTDSDKPTFLSRLAAINPESSFSKIITKFDTKTKDMANKTEQYFQKANDALFELVFGSDELDGKTNKGSFVKRTFEGLKTQFASFGRWMDEKLLTPIYEHLFGDDGFFTKLKESQFGQDLKRSFSNFAEKIFGKDNDDGNKEGGLLSDVVNEFKDAGKYAIQFFNGKEYVDSKGQVHKERDNSVLSVFKDTATRMSNSFRNFLGVEEFDPSKSKTGNRLLDGVDSIWTTVKTKTNEFIDDILGTPDESEMRREFSKFTNEVSDGLPAIAASAITGAGIGLIPSLFVPGGVIGGALIGAGLGIAAKSSKIKDFLFGPEEDGERTGGLIIKEMQDFFKDHKVGIGVGLGAGVAASMGIIPALFVPGGPIGGALIGGAISMANKSQSLQDFLFGKEDIDGNKIRDGIADKFENATGITFKDALIGGGMGAGAGLIGSLFLPGGPMFGAILGSAAGIALSSEKFKTYLFGEKIDGKRSGGMLGVVGDWTKEKLFNPLGKALKTAQINVLGFIKKEMVAPLAASMIPIKEEFHRLKTRLFEGVKTFFENFGERLNTSFDKHFGQPIGEFLETRVLNPLKSVISKIFGGIGKIFGAVVSSPFKLLTAVADGLYGKHQKEGIKDLNERTINTVFRSKDDQGNKITWGQKWNAIKEFSTPTGRDNARFGEKGAWYHNEYQDRLATYRAKVDADMAKKKKALDEDYSTGKINKKAYDAESSRLKADSKAAKQAVAAKTNDVKSTPTVTEEVKTKPVKPVVDKEDKATVAQPTATQSKVVETSMGKDDKTVKVTQPVSFDSKPRVTETTTDDVIAGTKPKLVRGRSVLKASKMLTGSDRSATVVSSESDESSSRMAKEAIDRSRGISKAKRDAILMRMDKNLQIIADSVKDQLDGVGKNVYNIRKILQKKMGISDDDLTGSANKDRKGFFGKILGMLKNPIRGLKELALAPLRVVASVGTYFKDKIVGVFDGVTKAISMTVSGMFKLAKGIGKAALDLLALPKTILQMGLEGLKIIGPVISETLVSGVKIVSKTITTGIDLIGTGVKALGSTIVEGAKGLGMLIGGALKGLGSLLSAAGIIAKDAAIMIGKGITKTVSFIGKGAANIIGGVSGFAFNTLFKGIDMLRGGRDKLKRDKVQRVTVEGGVLDSIKSIGQVDNVLKLPSPKKDKEADRPTAPATDAGGPTPLSPLPSPANAINNTTQPAPNVIKFPEFSPAMSDRTKNSKIGAKDISEEYGENTDGVVTGLRIFDEEKTAKAAEEKMLEEAQASRAAIVGSGSFETRSAEWAEAEKANRELSFRERLLDGITSIKDATISHAKNWSDMFGKKGLISMALLFGVPAILGVIKKILKFFGIGDGDDSTGPLSFFDNVASMDKAGRTDGDGNYYDSNAYENRWKKLGVTVAAKAFDALNGRGGTVAKFIAKNLDKFGGPFGKWINENFLAKAIKDPKLIAEAVGNKVLVESGEETLEKIGQKAVAEGAEKATKAVTAETAEKTVKKLVPEVAENTAKVATKEGMEKATKVAIEEGVENATPKLITETFEASTKLGAKFKAHTINRKFQEGAVEKGIRTGLSNAVTTTTEVASKVANKAMSNDTVSKFVGLISDWFNKVLNSDMVRKVLSSEALASIAKSLKSMLDNVADYLIKSGSKFLTRMGMAIAEDGSMVIPPLGAVVKVLFGASDFITGMTVDAGRIFQVAKEDVTMGMRIAAGVSKLLVGVLATVDLLNEIYYIISDGSSLRSFLAELIYDTTLKMGGNTDAIGQLEQAQSNFKDSYNAYNEQLAAEGKEQMSFVGYLDREHESLWSKTKRKVSQTWDNFKTNTSIKFDNFKTRAANTWSDVKEGASNIWSNVKSGVSNGWQNVKEGASNVWSNVKTGVSSGWQNLKSSASNIWSNVKSGVSTGWQNVKEGASNIWSNVKEGASNVWEKGKEYVGGIMETGKDFLGAVGEFYQVLFSPFTKFVSEKFTTIKDFLSNIWTTTIEPIKVSISEKLTQFKESLLNIWDGIRNAVSEKFGYVKEAVLNVWEDVKAKAEIIKTGAVAVFNVAKDAVLNVWDDIKEKANNVKERAVSLFNKAKDAVLNVWEDTKTKAVDIKERVSPFINKAKESITNLWDEAKTRAVDIRDVSRKLISKAKDAVLNVWEDAKTKAVDIKNKASKLIGEAKDKTLSIWETIKTGASQIADSIKSSIQGVISKVSNFFGGIWDSVKDFFAEKFPGLTEYVTNVSNAAKNVVDKGKKFVGSIFGGDKGGEDSTNYTPQGGHVFKEENLKRVKEQDKLSKPVAKPKSFKATDVMNDTTLTMKSESSEPRFDKQTKSKDKEKEFKGLKVIKGGKADQPADKGGEVFGPSMATNNDVYQGFSYYAQGDPRWGKKAYLTSGSDRSMAYGGCGPTSLAMVISQLTGDLVDPYAVAKESSKRGMVSGGGTSWSAMKVLPELAGLTSKFIGTGSTSYRFNDSQHSQDVKQALSENRPVILSGNRRTGASRDSSPYTTGGHFVVAHGMDGNNLVINDPRGREESKLYNFNEVMKETKGAWSFPQNVRGSYIGTGTDTSSNVADGNEPQTMESMGVLGFFTKAMDAFTKPLREFLYGTEPEEDDMLGLDEQTTSSYNSSAPTTYQGSIAEKTAELMRMNESSGDYAIAQNDKTGAGQIISPSIGVLQWREGNAKELMRRMYQKLPNDPDAKYYATKVNWEDRTPWTQAQLTRYRNFMTRNAAVSKQVQDQFTVEHVQQNILPNVYKHAVDPGRIKDPRSIVMLADISQTGPGHVKGFMTGRWGSKNTDYPHGTRTYNTTVPAGMTEFDHFNKEIRSPETNYWGKHITTYRSRFDKSYNALKSWMPADSMKKAEGPVATDKGGESTPATTNVKQSKFGAIKDKVKSICKFGSKCADKGGETKPASITNEMESSKVIALDKYKSAKQNKAVQDKSKPAMDISKVKPITSTPADKGGETKASTPKPAKVKPIKVLDDTAKQTKAQNTTSYGSFDTSDYDTFMADASIKEANNVTNITNNYTRSTGLNANSPVLNEIVSVLKGILAESKGTNKGIEAFNRKDFTQVIGGGQPNQIIVENSIHNNNTTEKTYGFSGNGRPPVKQKQKPITDTPQYRLAKDIAMGITI